MGATSSRSPRSDPDTGKRSEETVSLFITVPFLVIEAPTLIVDQPAEGATFENGAIPVQGRTTNATSVVVAALYTGPATPPAAGTDPPAPPAAPNPVTVPVQDDGSFTTPYELTTGKWAITVTASSSEGKSTALTRNVTVAFKGVNLAVSIKGGRAWLKVWVDGKVSDVTGPAGRVYSSGKDLTFTAKDKIEVRTGNAAATYFTVNGVGRRAVVEQGQPGDVAVRATRSTGADRPSLTGWTSPTHRSRTQRPGCRTWQPTCRRSAWSAA